MIDQMSSPVLFVLMFVLLLLVGGGLFLTVRVLGVGQRPDPTPAEPDAQPRETV
jgi:hypothetical protein